MAIDRVNSNNYLPLLARSAITQLRSAPFPQDSLTQACKSGGFFDPLIRFFKWLFCCNSTPGSGGGGNPVDLRAVFQETLQALHEGTFTTPSGKTVALDLEPMKENTVLYDQSFRLQRTRFAAESADITVRNEDSVQAGLRLEAEGYKVAVVNFANEDTPGGGIIGGARAQEEAICRSTALYASIAPSENPLLFGGNNSAYKIPEFGCIYSPDVPVLRGTEAEKFAWREDAPTLNFITSAAYHSRNRPSNDAEYEAGMRSKIAMQIKAAIDQRCNAFVAGAFGCGAFGNDPELVARLYQEELAKHPGAFEKIVFAVFVAKGGDEKNLQAFQETFSS